MGSNCNWSILIKLTPFSHFHVHNAQDGSGSISAGELLEVMRAMGQNPTEDEVAAILEENLFLPNLVLNLHQVLNMMMEADLDGNGSIEFPEFLELMTKK